jgi:hypothetical protein
VKYPLATSKRKENVGKLYNFRNWHIPYRIWFDKPSWIQGEEVLQKINQYSIRGGKRQGLDAPAFFI